MTVPIHQPFSIAPNNDFLPNLDEKLRLLNEQVEGWHVYWDEYQRVRGVPEGDILRESRESLYKVELTSVITAKSGSIMLSNALILHGIRRRRDVTDLSEERRGFLIKAVRAAERIVHMCLKSQTVGPQINKANDSTEERSDLETCLHMPRRPLLRGS